MASFEKRGSMWLARVRRKGYPTQSATFPSKLEARDWAARIEGDIVAGRIGRAANKTFGDLIKRYLEARVPLLDGSRQETLRLNRVLKDPIADVHLSELSAVHIAEWRDRRLAHVTAESVRREWSSLSRACTVAVSEWRWLPANPFRGVEQPEKGRPRERIFTDKEVDALLFACGYDRNDTPWTAQARVGAALLFALETAIRAGEICKIRQEDINGNTVTIRAVERGARKTKQGRVVPLSAEARRILKQLEPLKNDYVFGLTAEILDALFRKAKKRVLLEGVVFHDSRRTALTRMAKKLNALDLAKISGHRDLKILLNTYYSPDMEAVAELL